MRESGPSLHARATTRRGRSQVKRLVLQNRSWPELDSVFALASHRRSYRGPRDWPFVQAQRTAEDRRDSPATALLASFGRRHSLWSAAVSLLPSAPSSARCFVLNPPPLFSHRPDRPAMTNIADESCVLPAHGRARL